MVVSPVSRIALVSSSTNRGTPLVGDDGVDHLGGKRLAEAQSGHDRRDPGAPQPVEREPGDVGVGGDLRLEVWPAGQQEQDPGVGDLVQSLLDQLERGRVDPVGVLQEHEDRLPGCQPAQLLDERAQRPRPLPLRGHVEGTLARGAVEAEQIGDQGRGIVPASSLEQRVQLVEPDLEPVFRAPSAAPWRP
jgi:hypothetical protein